MQEKHFGTMNFQKNNLISSHILPKILFFYSNILFKTPPNLVTIIS